MRHLFTSLLLLLLSTPLLIATLPDSPADRGELCGRTDSTKLEEFHEFVKDGVPPSYDLRKLQSLVVYPALAQENGIEGKVYVAVYLDEKGRVVRMEIVKSDNDIFDASALDAIGKLTFTPATLYGVGIRFKTMVIIKYKLNNPPAREEDE